MPLGNNNQPMASHVWVGMKADRFIFCHGVGFLLLTQDAHGSKNTRVTPFLHVPNEYFVCITY